jgi:hypothetical protein
MVPPVSMAHVQPRLFLVFKHCLSIPASAAGAVFAFWAFAVVAVKDRKNDTAIVAASFIDMKSSPVC